MEEISATQKILGGRIIQVKGSVFKFVVGEEDFETCAIMLFH